MLNLAKLALLAGPVAAHVALWHPSAYGFFPDDRQNNQIGVPMNHWTFDKWWFHGYIKNPPAPGWFVELPAGGTAHVELACNKDLTTWGLNYNHHGHVCLRDHPETDTGMEHTPDPYSRAYADLEWVKGSAIAIAYESDPFKLKPESFTVISVNYSTPWFKDAAFHIPVALPECPAGGCHCLWTWNHSPNGGGQEMLANWFRCKVSGKTGTTPIPKAQLARKCPYDKNNCTVGAKLPFYWDQQQNNNVEQDAIDPPYYNAEYGWINGAQTDLWETGCTAGWVTSKVWQPYWATKSGNFAVTPATCHPKPTTPAYKNVAVTDVWHTRAAGQTNVNPGNGPNTLVNKGVAAAPTKAAAKAFYEPQMLAVEATSGNAASGSVPTGTPTITTAPTGNPTIAPGMGKPSGAAPESSKKCKRSAPRRSAN